MVGGKNIRFAPLSRRSEDRRQKLLSIGPVLQVVRLQHFDLASHSLSLLLVTSSSPSSSSSSSSSFSLFSLSSCSSSLLVVAFTFLALEMLLVDDVLLRLRPAIFFRLLLEGLSFDGICFAPPSWRHSAVLCVVHNGLRLKVGSP